MKRVNSKLLKNPRIWFLVLPFLVVGICNFFISLKPTAIAHVRLAQSAVELKIEMLKKEINVIVQWAVAAINVSMWYVRVISLFFVIGFISALVGCWIFFIKKFYIQWSRGGRRKVKK